MAARRAITAVAVAAVAFAAAVVGVPVASDAWQTWRTGIAPGSREAYAFASLGDELVVVGTKPTKDSATPAVWRVRGQRWAELGGVPTNVMLLDVIADDGTALVAGASGGRPTVFEIRGKRVLPRSMTGRTGDVSSVATCDKTAVAAGTLTEDRLAGVVLGRQDAGWLPLDVPELTTATAATCSADDFFVFGSRAVSNAQTIPLVLEGRADRGWVDLELGPAGRWFVTGAASTDDTVVAVGLADNAPAAWVSEGGQWTFAGQLTEGAPPGERARAVVADPAGGFVAVGSRTGLGDVTSPVAWRSDDGRTWQPVGVSGSRLTGLTDVTIAGGRVIAIGNDVDRKRHVPQFYELRGSSFVSISSVSGGG